MKAIFHKLAVMFLGLCIKRFAARSLPTGRCPPNKEILILRAGRPTKYTDALADTICAQLMEGISLRSICLQDGMPDRGTVFNWILVHDDFAAKYASAREAQADTLADEILDISDDGSNDWMERAGRAGEVVLLENPETINRSRLRIDTRKWFASKLKPKKYGEKSQVEMGGPNGGPIETKDVSARELLASRIAGIAARLQKGCVSSESDSESE